MRDKAMVSEHRAQWHTVSQNTHLTQRCRRFPRSSNVLRGARRRVDGAFSKQKLEIDDGCARTGGSNVITALPDQPCDKEAKTNSIRGPLPARGPTEGLERERGENISHEKQNKRR